ncbi:hypothetical protein PAPYR_11930 [Paratrimastix pyriformis]|uniref:Uncharacterized protein n=1 Tax=Paratrimastix pyriformis TaxID=342808 RepID=A0ABQ8U2T5_9EUKA|nr:hypothetical protein PAPYR_11930 [Paratrimastix pyriformis]
MAARWVHELVSRFAKRVLQDGRILACQCIGYTTTSGVQDQFETAVRKLVTKDSLPQKHLFTFLAACPSHLARKAPVKFVQCICSRWDFDARQTCIRGPNISGHPKRAATGRP